MRIGIDIDGVLTNIIQYICDYSSKYFYEKYGKLDINFNVYALSEMFNVGEEEARESWVSILENYASNEPARPFASEIIKKLKEEGNEIYIITARCANDWSNLDNRMFDLVKRWLKSNDIFYDKLIFSTENKLDICIENNVDIMIEDNSENVNQISTKIPVICYHANHNMNCNGKNIYRAYSWYHVYEIIKNYLNIK